MGVGCSWKESPVSASLWFLGKMAISDILFFFSPSRLINFKRQKSESGEGTVVYCSRDVRRYSNSSASWTFSAVTRNDRSHVVQYYIKTVTWPLENGRRVRGIKDLRACRYRLRHTALLIHFPFRHNRLFKLKNWPRVLITPIINWHVLWLYGWNEMEWRCNRAVMCRTYRSRTDYDTPVRLFLRSARQPSLHSAVQWCSASCHASRSWS